MEYYICSCRYMYRMQVVAGLNIELELLVFIQMTVKEKMFS